MKKEEKETRSHSQSRFFVSATCYPPSAEPVVTAFKTRTITITSPKVSSQMVVLALQIETTQSLSAQITVLDVAGFDII